ncbi:PhzF family phenazine biosynthesis isomerase [Brevibacillus composti]|uniref:PhzF family phenazine biosynthesis isomerase n=1 Tax=Brevibacillus composti TaxID=2796470 RepID=A0A7T5EJS5_9BACL|nr:PhzF family phenazine biosynthesis isomerase [Brevibacillus composti]QQE73835.1 PhzF family phenazine biosynthesis isomerase [Brevibacillus composti]QUO40920.1 PhzF family phenazine biosynthesis isomerase [Brevibacillus composti]
MKTIKVCHYEAFTRVPHKGNPAGLVLDADGLTEEEMREIAEQVGFTETSFPFPSDVADLRIRYFTPGHEMDLCGHATIATIYALTSRGLLGEKKELTIETKAGILPIRLEDDGAGGISITMQQAAPQFQPFGGSLHDVAQAMGIEESDLDPSLPVMYGSTGIWTLLIPVKGLEPFRRMKPHNERFPAILTERPRASLHPFCLETYHPDAQMHARHFSSPYSGTVEDPVTGTASGAMGAYYAQYIRGGEDSSVRLVVEQGREMGRDGKVGVSVAKREGQYEVEISGQAVFVDELEVKI